MNKTKRTYRRSDLKPTQQKIFIGVSWPYANGPLSIGHLAGQNVVCDVFARYHRLRGNKVLMVSGADAHGTPVTIRAEQDGITPEQAAEKYYQGQLKTFAKLNCLWDHYTTTEAPNHHKVAQNLFKTMFDLGYIFPKEVEQYYDEKAEKYLADRYIEGTCPFCGNTRARGDQCNDGCERTLDPTDLIDPKSKLTGTTPILKKHTILYFDLSKFQKEIEKFVDSKEGIWRTPVIQVARKWLKEGLRPRPVTRKLGYGIKVPIEKYKDQDIYVWFEAVMGYLSAAIEWASVRGEPSGWEDFWKDPDSKHYYFIAKDNIPFHTFLWPGMIMAYNHKYDDGKFAPELPGETNSDELQLPYDVPSNQFLNMRGARISKSRGTMITADELLDKYNPDVVRYFFVRNAPENHDREFGWEDFIETNNKELVANLGNFVNRVLSFTHSKFEGEVPEGKLEKGVEKAINQALTQVGGHLEKAEFTRSVEALLKFGQFANKYLNDKAPWDEIKENPEKAGLTLFNAIQIISTLRILLKPYTPATSEKIRDLLGLPKEYDANNELAQTGSISQYPDTWQFTEVPEGQTLNQPEILFEKLEYTEDLQKADNPEPESYVTTTPLEHDFSHVGPLVVVGKILSIEDKVTSIDIGADSPLQIVCKDTSLKKGQIVPVALPGAKVRSINTDKPIKIKKSAINGIPSDGMLCGTHELEVGDEKKHIYILPDGLKELLGKPLASIRSIQFTVADKLKDKIPTAWAVFPNIEIKKNRSGKLDRWVKEQETKIREANSDTNWRDKTVYKEFRKLHEEFGVKDTPASAEEIVAEVVEGDGIPNINTIADLYNTYSALTGISIGAHDIEKIKGNVKLVVLDKDLPFKHVNTGEDDTAKKGEFTYVDDEGLLCRMDIKQGNRTPVTEETRNVVVLFGGNKVLDQKRLDEAMEEFKESVKKLLN